MNVQTKVLHKKRESNSVAGAEPIIRVGLMLLKRLVILDKHI